MKNSELTYTLIGIVVLAIIAWFVFGNAQPDIQENTNPNAEEVVETETELGNPEGTSTQEESPTETGIATAGAPGGTVTDGVMTAPANFEMGTPSRSIQENELFPGIFTFGVYYIENINKKGIEACKPKPASEVDRDDEEIDFSPKNFQLEQIMYKNGQVFLSINAQEIPENMCAYILQKELGNSPFSAVHLIVQ